MFFVLSVFFLSTTRTLPCTAAIITASRQICQSEIMALITVCRVVSLRENAMKYFILMQNRKKKQTRFSIENYNSISAAEMYSSVYRNG